VRRHALLVLAFLAACRSDSRPRTPFDGAAALAHTKTQLDFGPRIPGSEGHRRTGDWLVERGRATADTVIEQRFSHVTVKGDTLPLRNILYRFRPRESQRVLYVTHWDSRPVSDGPNESPERRASPMPGANDGAAGVGVLVALAEALKRTPPDVGVDLLFVDGEDYGNFDDGKDVLLGSRYFAEHLPDSAYRPLYGVLWDMIGKQGARFTQEQFSLQKAPEVVALVWKQAQELGYGSVFVAAPGVAITDDHVPLLNAGLHVIDVIDYDYPEHHTTRDVLGMISQRSLQTVGDVAYALVVRRE
jgi:glutaminyl-peptide cyclotransferase